MNDLTALIRFYERRYDQPPGAMRDYGLYLGMAGARAGERVLDVGCGEGFLLAEAAAAGLRACGVEIVYRALQLARQRASAGVAVAAGVALPFRDASFDLVICLGSLEHFTEPPAGIREVARVLHPSARALIVVPNRRFVGWRLRGRKGTEQQAASELLLDEREWTALLRSGGLRVVRAKREPWYTKPTPSLLRRLVLRTAWLAIPRRWTYQFAFLCKRDEPAAGSLARPR